MIYKFGLDDFSIAPDPTLCIKCGKMKPIPEVRQIKKCDECFEEEMAARDAADKLAAEHRRWENYLIPKRYWDFDVNKLEIPQETFETLCKQNVAVAIFGDKGTGKTNLACQILFRRGGEFRSAVEVADAKNNVPLKEAKCLVIDDITKLDTSNPKRMERFFEVFNFRYHELRPVIVTLDETKDEVEQMFGEFGRAFMRRVEEWTYKIKLTKKWG